MPVRLHKFNKGGGDKTVTLQCGEDGDLNLTYSRERYTRKLEREMKKAMDDGLPGHMLAGMLLKVLKDWDLMDVHPEDVEKAESKQRLVKVPLTEETFDDVLSVEAMGRIVEALAEDNRPNPEKSEQPSVTS